MRGTTRASIFTFACLMGLPVGCAPKVAVKPDFDSPLPQDRLAAVAQARRSNDQRAVKPLIEMLASDDPLMRLVASDTLKRLTSQDFGYDPAGSDAERQAAADRWAEWYSAAHASPEGRAGL